MDDEIRSLRSWDGTGKIYSEETVQMLQDEIAQLQARVTELVEQANAAYGPYQQKVNYLQNLVSMKNDALSSYAEFYGRAASFCGLPEDALPSGQTDAIILQRLAEHDEIARLREAQRWIPVSDSKSLNDLDLYLVTDGEIVSVGFYTTKWGTWTSADDLLLPFNVTHWMPLPEPPQEAEGN